MSKPTVLLIDDQKYFLLLIKEIVEDAGYKALITDDVDEGVKLFYEKKPNMLFLDIVMPKEFGTEVCKDLKETEQGKNTPIVLMSSGVKEMEEEGSLSEYNADEYILKPFEREIFLGLLKKYLVKEDLKIVEQRTFDENTEKGLGKDFFKIDEQSGQKKVPKLTPLNAKTSSDQKSESVAISQVEGGLEMSIKVDSKTRNIFLGNSMVNVINGGIFVTSDYPAPLGIKVFLKLICGKETIDLKGMVVWMQPANLKSGQSAGMGIRFHDQKAEGLEKLKRFVNSLTAQ